MAGQAEVADLLGEGDVAIALWEEVISIYEEHPGTNQALAEWLGLFAVTLHRHGGAGRRGAGGARQGVARGSERPGA